MKQYLHIPVMILLVAALMLPAAPARADRWYQSGWVIGGAGLLVGTIIGASIVESGRTTRQVTTYETRPVYVVRESNPRWVTTNYVEETRVWPFYRKTRVYPVISRTEYEHEAVSMAHRVRPGQAAAPAGPSGGIDIKVGDNNQNVNINVTTGDGREAVRTRTVTIPNAPAGVTGGRMVDIQVPVEDEKESSAADNDASAEPASE